MDASDFKSEIDVYGKTGDTQPVKPEHVVRLIERGLEGMQMVRIELDKDDDPQRIFDSINHLGFVLSESDLIRNYILQGLPNKEKRREYHDKYWLPIEKAAKDEDGEDKVPDFFRHYLTMKLGKPVKERGEEGVYETFRDAKKLPSLQFKTKGKTNVDQCKNVLCEILRFASYYEKFLNPKVEKDSEISRQLEYIRHLPQAGVILPFLLQIYDDYEKKIIDKKTLVGVAELIQSYVVRCIFASRRRQAYNRLWAGLYYKSFDNKSVLNITGKDYLACIQRGLGNRDRNEMFPDDEDVEAGIQTFPVYKSNRNFTKYILRRLEEKLRGGKKYDTIPDYQSLTIEHIYPQNAEKGRNWVGTGPLKISEEEHKSIKRDYLHVLGNLTLTIYNSEMGNKGFSEKVRIGFKPSGLRLNDRLDSSFRKWDTKRIIERTKELSQLFFTIWGDIPPKYKEPAEVEATPILDIESLTNEGKPIPIEIALFGTIEIPFQKKAKLSWFKTTEELVPEETSEGRFYDDIMYQLYAEHEGSLEAIGLIAVEREGVGVDENGNEFVGMFPFYIVPWEPEEGTGTQKDKYRVRIKYEEMLENLKQAAKHTDTADKLKIKFADEKKT